MKHNKAADNKGFGFGSSDVLDIISLTWYCVRKGLRLQMTKLLVSNALQTSLWVNPSGLFSNCCSLIATQGWCTPFLHMWSSKVMRRVEKNWLTAHRAVSWQLVTWHDQLQEICLDFGDGGSSLLDLGFADDMAFFPLRCFTNLLIYWWHICPKVRLQVNASKRSNLSIHAAWIGPWPGTEVQRISFKLKSNANRHGQFQHRAFHCKSSMDILLTNNVAAWFSPDGFPVSPT